MVNQKWNQIKPDHSFPVHVSKSGNYHIVAALGEKMSKSYLSGITVSISNVFDVTNKTEADESLGYGWDAMKIALYKRENVYIEKGDYMIDVIVDMCTNGEKVYKYTYDYIEFIPSSMSNDNENENSNSPKSFSVRFNTNGAGVIPAQMVAKGETATLPAELVKKGFTFGGWYVDNAFSTPFNFDNIIDENITLYAKWVEAPISTLEISVTLDGVKVNFDQPPIIVDDRPLVPLRAIFEALGATVDWNPENRTVTSVKEDTTVSLTIGIAELYKNGAVIAIDVPPQIVGDRTLVPVRAIAESFNLLVDWDAPTRTVVIKTIA